MEPLPPITKVYSLVVQDKNERKIGSMARTSVDKVAFMNKRIDNTKQTHGNSRLNVGKQQYKKGEMICTHCGMTNQIVDKCYKLYGYPPNFKQKGESFTSKQHNGPTCIKTAFLLLKKSQ